MARDVGESRLHAPWWVDPDAGLTIHHGDCRDVLPSIDLSDVSLVIADPPYGDTNIAWDSMVPGWPALLADLLPSTVSMWVFGSLRCFMASDLGAWTYAQEAVWEKHNGSNMAADRLRRVHELILHVYRGKWSDLPVRPVYTADATARTVRRKMKPAQWNPIEGHYFESHDGGPRLQRSVMYVRSDHGRAVHPTQKPTALLHTLIEHACPPGGLVLDPFMGSGSTLVAARDVGRRAIGIERSIDYCKAATERLGQQVLVAQSGSQGASA